MNFWLVSEILFYCKFFADLTTVLDRNVDELSGGELQRFACAVVCIQKADMYVTSFESSHYILSLNLIF